MAGDMRVGGVSKARKSRKLWSLQDRSVMSIHLLKATLAEDGCDEAQLDVAKKLLNGDSNDIPAEAVQSENARLAIYWLVKSSEQGNEEATTMLTECFESGQGMTCQNVLDVKTCINTPIHEKLTFKAARLLFDKLNNGEDYITTTQLLARLESRKSDRKVSFNQNATQHQQPPQPRESFINRNRNRTSPPKSTSTTEGNPPKSEFDPNRTFIIDSPVHDKVGYNHEDSFTYSLETQYLPSYRYQEGVKLTSDDLAKIAAVYNKGQLPPVSINSSNKLEPQHQWKFVTVWNAFILQCIVLSFVSGFITRLYAILLSLSFLGLWSSYNFCAWRRRKSCFADWTEAFRSVLQHKNWAEDGVASKFSRKYYQPSMLCNVLCLILFSTFGGHPSLKMFVGSMSLFGLVFGRIINLKPSWQLVAVFSIQALSQYASILPELSPLRLLDIDFTDLVYSSIPDNFPLDGTNMVAYVQVMLLIHYLLYSKKGNFVTDTIPKFLAGLWLFKLVQWTQECSGYEEYAVVTGTVVCFAILFICLDSNVAIWKVVIGFLLASAIICISLGIYSTILSEKEEPTFLDWKDYEQNCHRSAWKTQTMAETQINCLLKYQNARVAWQGRISLVNLQDHEKRTWDNKLINIVFELLVNAGMEETLNSNEMANIWKWTNHIPYIGFPKMDNNVAPVSVWISTNGLSDFDRTSIIRHILNLRTGDVIEFRGTLTQNLGGLKPEVGNVESIKCISCEVAESGEVLLKSDSMIVTVMKFFSALVNLVNEHEETLTEWSS